MLTGGGKRAKAVAAFLAVAVMSGLCAVSSSAVQFTSEAGKYPVSVAGKQLAAAEFTLGNRTITCTTVQVSGSLSASSSELTVTPSYESCHSVVFGSLFDVTVTMNGCTYRTTATEKVETEFAGEMHVVCPTGKKVEVHVYNGSGVGHIEVLEQCHYDINPQTSKNLRYRATKPGLSKAVIDGTHTMASTNWLRTNGSVIACGTESGVGKYTASIEMSGSVSGVAEGIHVG